MEWRDNVRGMLLQRQSALLNEIGMKVRDVRDAGYNNHHRTTDLRDTIEAEPEDDLVFALIQMKAEMLEKVNVAIRHLAEGTYGYCMDCGDVITAPRLRAMPFAVRCRDCEEAREAQQHRDRVRSPQNWLAVRS